MKTNIDVFLISQDVEFSVDEISKYFNPGEHVIITRGDHVGETGTIVHVDVDKHTARVKSDTSLKEMLAPLNYLQVSASVAGSLDSLGGYELYDLVNLEGYKTGVVVHVGREELKILHSVRC